MQRDARCYLWDALKAAEAVQTFLSGKTYEAFIGDDLPRSAVERQLEIVGQALSQLAKVDPQMAGSIFELGRIVAFRNILVHGYSAIDYDTVWRLIEDKLPELQTNLRMLLRTAGCSPDPSE
jgi:uncharacterized protein with HEPN domain